MASGLQHQTRHPKKRFAQQCAADATGDLIIYGRWRRFTRYLPEDASCKRVRKRFPKSKTGRPCGSVVDRALIGMQELVRCELVIVDDPSATQVTFDR